MEPATAQSKSGAGTPESPPKGKGPVSGPGSCAAEPSFSLAEVIARKKRQRDPFPSPPGGSGDEATRGAQDWQKPLEAIVAPCETCGEPTSTLHAYCASCQRKFIERTRDRQRFEELGAWATVPLHYATARLDDATALDTAQRANMIELRAELGIIQAKRGHHGGNIILGGAMGRGKTHLACAAVSWCRDHGITAAFVPTVKLLGHLRSAYHPENPTQETDVIDAVEGVEFLVLDDLGKERNSPWAEEKLYEIVNDRVSEDRPILVTMNIDPQVLTDRSGTWAAIMDRISQHKTVIEFEGDSYRRTLVRNEVADDLPF